MKKVLVFGLTLALIFSMSMSVFAAGAFVSSPSGNPAPGLVSGSNESEDCEAELEITPYSERDDLDDDERKHMENAYDDISSTDDVTSLNDDLKNLAKDKDIKGSNLAVSDLFHIGMTDCDAHQGHGKFKIELDAETLKNFVALLRFDGENWHLIDDAAIKNGNLQFTSKDLGNFAIVVNTAAGGAPQTGDNSNIYLWVMVFAGSALVAVIVLMALNKKKHEE